MEKELVDYILSREEAFFGLSIDTLKEVAVQYAERMDSLITLKTEKLVMVGFTSSDNDTLTWSSGAQSTLA
jgi:hypothetical protein